jgi:hypothetical protein
LRPRSLRDAGKFLAPANFATVLPMDTEHADNRSITPALHIQLMDLGEGGSPSLLLRLPYLLALGMGHDLSEGLWLKGLDRLMLLFLSESAFQVVLMPRQHLLQCFTEIMDEMPTIGNLKNSGAPRVAPSAKVVPRSRLMTSTMGCDWSQAAKNSAVASSSRSIGT